MIKAIGFDLGGVIIVYSIPHQLEVLSHRLNVSQDKLEMAYHRLRPALDVGALSNHEFWVRLLAGAGSAADPSQSAHLWSDNYNEANPFITGMLELVDSLKAAGYGVGLLSNIDDEHGEINRRRHIYDHFDVVLLSNEIQARKPEPAAYQRLTNALSVAPAELVFIDDLPINVTGANEFGAHGILFTGYKDLLAEFDRLGVRYD